MWGGNCDLFVQGLVGGLGLAWLLRALGHDDADGGRGCAGRGGGAGRLLLTRYRVHLISDILDTPEFFWERPELRPLNTQCLEARLHIPAILFRRGCDWDYPAWCVF